MLKRRCPTAATALQLRICICRRRAVACVSDCTPTTYQLPIHQLPTSMASQSSSSEQVAAQCPVLAGVGQCWPVAGSSGHSADARRLEGVDSSHLRTRQLCACPGQRRGRFAAWLQRLHHAANKQPRPARCPAQPCPASTPTSPADPGGGESCEALQAARGGPEVLLWAATPPMHVPRLVCRASRSDRCQWGAGAGSRKQGNERLRAQSWAAALIGCTRMNKGRRLFAKTTTGAPSALCPPGATGSHHHRRRN